MNQPGRGAQLPRSAGARARLGARPRAQHGPWSVVCIALAAAGLGLGCAPKVSAIPLGVGPLALAEQHAAEEHAQAAPRAVARPPAATVAAAPLVSNDDEEPEAPDDAAEAPGSDDAEPHSATSDSPEFAGLFAGKDVAIFRIAGLPERQEVDDKAKIRIESDSPTALRIALINSENGSDLCELSAAVEGHSAILDPGQPCFSSEGEGAIQAELSLGKLVLQGDRLSMDAEGTLSVSLADDELEGKLSYSFKGKRQ